MKSPIRAQTKKRQKRRAYSVTNYIATQKPTKVGSSAEAAGDGLMKHVQNAKRWTMTLNVICVHTFNIIFYLTTFFCSFHTNC
jgi:hypothetical protein